MTMESFLGTVWFSVLVFVAGAWLGGPLFKWVWAKLPFGKD